MNRKDKDSCINCGKKEKVANYAVDVEIDGKIEKQNWPICEKCSTEVLKEKKYSTNKYFKSK